MANRQRDASSQTQHMCGVWCRRDNRGARGSPRGLWPGMEFMEASAQPQRMHICAYCISIR
jgi:hypothetical protein